MVLVSVIIPTFNRLDTLGRAVQSVLDQTLSDLEVVVVNDRGDDAWDDIPQLRDPRVTYLGHVRNSGPSASRNTAILASSGRYLAYLDDDDFYYPHHLETLISFLESSEARSAYSDAMEVTLERTDEGLVERSREVVYSREFNPLEMLARNLFPNLTLVHERSCLKHSGMFDESLSSHNDWDFGIRLTSACPPVHLATVTAEYFKIKKTERVSVSGNRRDILRTILKVYRKYRKLSAPYPPVLQLQLLSIRALEEEVWGSPRVEKLLEMAAFYQELGEYEQALRVCTERLEHGPDPEALLRLKTINAAMRSAGKR